MMEEARLSHIISHAYEQQTPIGLSRVHRPFEIEDQHEICAVINQINSEDKSIELIQIIGDAEAPLLAQQTVQLLTLPSIGSSVQFQAFVLSDIRLGDERILTVNLEDKLQFLNRRHEVRIAVREIEPICVELLWGNNRHLYCFVNNLSLHGMQFSIHSNVSDEIQIGDEVNVQISSEAIDETIYSSFEISWVSFDYLHHVTEIGGTFKNRNRQSLFALGELISDLRSKEEKRHRRISDVMQ